MTPAASDSTLVQKLFALRAVRPFDRLEANEAVLIARVARARAYPPGAVIHPGGAPLGRLLVLTEGAVRDGLGGAVGPIIGVRSLLHDLASPPLAADPAAGARLLELSKRHFYTLARECPALVIGLIELGEQGRGGAGP
jgi:signal-transduction protein with cAMP-binding, CBS, and nucleotidyltransferase domain